MAKKLVIVLFLLGILYGGSYMGARSVAGRMLGNSAADMGAREIKFVFDSVPGLKESKQPMWVFTFTGTKLTGAKNAKIYLSLTGHLIATNPKNLQAIIDQAGKSKEPS